MEPIKTPLYYGVYTPTDNSKEFNNTISVFEDKNEALKLVKKNKKSRFKAFQFYHEAAEFATNGSECPNNNTTVDGPLFQKKGTESAQPVGEKGSPFKGPKPQELVELRKAIEVGNYESVKNTIWTNPRYLVSSGDTPSILQEGSRYNALHVAAKSKQGAITELILNTISSVDFVKLLYGDDNHLNAEERTKMLLDLYLNTPNKGTNETPLHFASKHGADEVVEVLVSYPQCDKTLRNRFQQTAEEIICSRIDSDTPAATKSRIRTLLENSYYVPVLRTEDNTLPPTIGQIFSPTSPPVLNQNKLSPRLEIHAYAGPMNKEGAEEFRKKWRTPPRNASGNILNRLRFGDPEKGLERIGKQLANEHAVSWKEYWHFLDSFVDITSAEGLNLLEKHLNVKSLSNVSLWSGNMTYSPSAIIVNNVSVDESPISNLCNVLQACRINDSSEAPLRSAFDPLLHIEKAVHLFANRISNDILYISWDYNNIESVLETEMKQLEVLITSYMDDIRFNGINFQKVHARLGALIGQKLFVHMKDDEARANFCEKLEALLDSIRKSLDCFSSDDETSHVGDRVVSRKPTTYKKQIACLVHAVLTCLVQNFNSYKHYDDINCEQEWNATDECICAYHLRRIKRNNSLLRKSFKNEGEGFPRKLVFDEENLNDDCKMKMNGIILDSNCNGFTGTIPMVLVDDLMSDDEEYFTPPSSIPSPEPIDSDDEFNDTQLPISDVFIEGDFPSKTDCAVFNALKLSDSFLDPENHPNVYKWRHNISLYPESERNSWLSPNKAKLKRLDQSLNVSCPAFTQPHSPIPHSSTPSKSWLRITGANSPRALFKSYQMNPY